VTQANARPTALASCHALPTAATLAMSHSVSPRNGNTPTVLLVHGAFADGSMWAGVITELQAAGIDVIAMASPLRSLTSDAAYIASAVAEIDGPILLVGHGTVVQRSRTTVGPGVFSYAESRRLGRGGAG
jgi:pimeloyl-ACP methyl ester carboxylesterase